MHNATIMALAIAAAAVGPLTTRCSYIGELTKKRDVVPEGTTTGRICDKSSKLVKMYG